MRTEIGDSLNMKPQAGSNVNGILVSIGRVEDVGNMTVFGGNATALRKAAEELDRLGRNAPNFVYNRSGGKINEIQRKDGLYRYPVWIKRGIRNAEEKDEKEDTGDWCTPTKGKIKWGSQDKVMVTSNKSLEWDLFDPF